MDIELIKAKVLDLAIHGKLVEQREDEKLSEEAIALPQIQGAFVIPSNWKWIKIKDAVSKAEQTIPINDFLYIDVSSIDNKRGTIQNAKKLHPSEAPSRARKIVLSGDVLYSTIRPYLNNICLANNIPKGTIASTAFAVMHCKTNIILNSFLFRILVSTLFRNYVISKQKGISYPAISETDFFNAPIILPPISEQQRISNKLEEIYSLLDQINDHKSNLLSSVDLIRKAAIDRAIRGKLVEQREEEKLSEEVTALPQVEGPFDIPNNWKWVQLSNVSGNITDGSHNPPADNGSGIPLLSAKNIINNKINFEEVTRWVTEEQWELENKKNQIAQGDVLLTIVGTIGRTAIVQNNEKFMLQRSVASIKPSPIISNKYLNFYLQSNYCQNWLYKFSRGTAQKGIYLKSLKKLSISLPSVSEQKRIVAKLEEIICIADTIKNLIINNKLPAVSGTSNA